MRRYEVMLILRPDADEALVGSIVDRISSSISSAGGSVGSVDRWGKRRLAYQIEKLSEGYYLVVEFGADPKVVTQLERALAFADGVVRFKVVRREAA